MNWKIIGIIFFLLVIPVMLKWILDNRDYGEVNYYTKNQKPVVEKEADELFGTETEVTTYEDGFWLGLLPNDTKINAGLIVGALPISMFLIVLGFVSLYMHKKKSKKELK